MERIEVLDLLSKKYLPEEDKKSLKKTITQYFGKKDLAEKFIKIQPIYYDTSKLWWFWNKQEYKWELIDETDIINLVDELCLANTVKSNERGEILESLRQVGRKNKPKDIKHTWIQFKDFIYDIKNGNKFKSTSEYFVTNPIPYELHPDKFETTPTIDKIFNEWVGEKYVKTLYEIIAYCMLPNYPIHRIFCLIGEGLNGKSCFLSLLRKFIGKDNVCSTELDTLLSSRFEVTRLHKKLVCQMGETNFNEMSKTSMLKKLTGGDLIGFEYKNKNPFEDENYAKILIATNNLPNTTDKTIGFYRRWIIIDFPNRFSEKKDILKDIPEEEYKSLALKLTTILKDLLDKREFYNEGTIEQRMEKYESKSNFLDKFMELFIEENLESYITKSMFYKKLTEWCKENRNRIMSETSVGLQMKKLGIESGRKNFNWMFDGKGGQARVWLGIKFK